MKSIKFTLEDLFNMPDAVIYNPDGFKSASSVSIDSRTIKKNSIFVAVKGENFDGHKFINEAESKGTAAVVISKRKLKEFDNLDCTIVTVENTLDAYSYLASVKRSKFDGKVISLTGSSGKTTVKEMIADLLSEKYKTHKTEYNNNNHIGVPLTIHSAPANSEVLVIEHGTNHFGEIEYTAKIAKPDIAIITNIGSSHLEFLKDSEGVLKEKSSLLEITNENGGLILLNTDDKYLTKLKNKFDRKLTFGFKGKPEIKGAILGYDELGCPEIEIAYLNSKIKIKSILPGKANALNTLTAVSAAFASGLTKKEIIAGCTKFKPVKGRLNFHEFENSILVDDTYNSNPESLKNAADFLQSIKKLKRKVFVLGDMFELGKNSKQIHENSASIFKSNKNVEVYTIGRAMKSLNNKLAEKKCISKHFSNRMSLMKFLDKLSYDNAAVLFKGSRGMKMEEFFNHAERRLN